MFTTRNIRYLRISRWAVLQVIIYLGEEHTEWFNDALYEQILAVLKPRIPERLRKDREQQASAATRNKVPTADVCAVGELRFAYWFKPMETRHAVLLKNKEFQFDNARANKKSSSDAHVIADSDDDADDGGDLFMIPESPKEDSDNDDELKKKDISITYQGFSIFGLCLCIVAEPIPKEEAPKVISLPRKKKGKDGTTTGFLAAPSGVKVDTLQTTTIQSFFANGLAENEV